MPANLDFHPHGIFFSNATSKFYTISHTTQEKMSRVEVFNVEPSDTKIPKLRYLITNNLK